MGKQLGVEDDKVKEDSKFVDDLGADSLDAVEMVMALEDEFGVEIGEESAEKLASVQARLIMILGSNPIMACCVPTDKEICMPEL